MFSSFLNNARVLLIVAILFFLCGVVVRNSIAQGNSGEVYLPIISSDSLDISGQATLAPTPSAESTSIIQPTVMPQATPTAEPTSTIQLPPTISTGTSIDLLLSGHRSVSTIRYDTEQGKAIFQGDIVLGPVNMLEVEPSRGYIVSTHTESEDNDGIGLITQYLVAISGSESGGKYRWPAGIIPYTFDTNVSSGLRSQIQTALNTWNNSTNLTFIVRSNERDYVRFIVENDLSGNSGRAAVGRRGGRQDVELSANALSGVVIHKMGHAVGLWHEQSRLDRDSFIEILWDNIEADSRHNFDKHVDDGIAIGPYDFNSIMHYQSTTFGRIDSLTGRQLETVRSRISGSTISPGSTLSVLDIQGVNQLYPLNNCGRVPLLFEHINQGGNSISLEYSKPNLSTFSFNDNASSLCIPLEWSISLYVDSDYNGRRIDLAGPLIINNLRTEVSNGENWSDVISSAHVYGVQANPLPIICDSTPVAFEHDHYRGRQIQLTDNAADLAPLSFGDTISSICVPEDWVLKFREHAGYEGEFLDVHGPLGLGDIRQDSPDQHNWNDVLSSVQVIGLSANQTPQKCNDNPILFEHDHFRGTQFDLTHDLLSRYSV